ncbi:unnamed protein product [Mesocestoides corti]|uniref:Uncharacterized protein n=1 Tax=Mesocestoides corti TaxID=53468 RepID=A0A0R3UA30_MESCO|nr:unnamed protein product [Mesocestoides corti]
MTVTHTEILMRNRIIQSKARVLTVTCFQCALLFHKSFFNACSLSDESDIRHETTKTEMRNSSRTHSFRSSPSRQKANVISWGKQCGPVAMVGRRLLTNFESKQKSHTTVMASSSITEDAETTKEDFDSERSLADCFWSGVQWDLLDPMVPLNGVN